MARRVGAQLAMSIKDLQEKYNQFVIFYCTGKLAYVSSKGTAWVFLNVYMYIHRLMRICGLSINDTSSVL